MKKNNKGFFLAETIVVVALVTTVMAFLYPNISNLYDNYNNRTKYYDQTEDLYALRVLNDYFLSLLNTSNDPYNTYTENGCKIFSTGDITSTTSATSGLYNFYRSFVKDEASMGVDMKLEQLYLTGYMTSVSSNNYNFNRYLKRLKRTTYDGSAYRLIGVFKVTDEDGKTITRYASIKIDNPNPNRGCNL